jgi:hypothetical protein
MRLLAAQMLPLRVAPPPLASLLLLLHTFPAASVALSGVQAWWAATRQQRTNQ